MGQDFFYRVAMENLARGRSTIPLKPRDKVPHFKLLPKGADGKRHWGEYANRLPTPKEIARWSERSHDAANIGDVMGRVSNLVGFDIDYRHGGDKTWREISGNRKIVTEIVQPNDGLHFRFLYPGFRCRLREPHALPRGYFKSLSKQIRASAKKQKAR